MHDKTQSVRLSNTLSYKLNEDSEVPQDSVLGPILFFFYANDLAGRFKVCSIILYADDTQFLQADTVNYLENLISKTEDTLHNVKQHFLRNGLTSHPQKTQCISNGNKQLLSRPPLNTY